MGAGDRSRAKAALEGARRSILEAALRDPTPLRNADAYYAANVNLVHTPSGPSAAAPSSITSTRRAGDAAPCARATRSRRPSPPPP